MIQLFCLGIEISSPVISDNNEDVAHLHALLDTMQELGFYYDEELENCAGQINIGIDYFNSPQAFLIFMETFCNAEEVLFHIANKEGQLIRQTVSINSRFKPISGIVGNRIIDEDITWDEALSMFEPSDWRDIKKNQIEGLEHKKNSICLRDKGIKNDERLEIRIFNGSTEFDIWKENILLIGKMAEFANRCADILLQRKEATPEDEKLLWNREELREEDYSLEKKLYIFMDLIFLDDDKSKQIYIDRFFALEKKIEETRTMKYRSDNRFKSVGFEGVYHSKIEEPNNVISYDPDDGR